MNGKIYTALVTLLCIVALACSVRAFAVTPQPSAITGAPVVCQGTSSVVYSVVNVPATNYSWTFTGTGINNISAVTVNTVTINFSATATSGTLIVTANDGSGVSNPSQLFITVSPLPANPGFISGNSNPCQGTTNISYSVVNNPVVTYAWTYSGSGLTFTPPANANSVIGAYSNSATSGTVTVTATDANSCSSSATLPIVVRTIPAVPSAISGDDVPCQGTSLVPYSVVNDPLVTYSWAYSGSGLTFNPPNNVNAVTANYSNTASGGTITVTAIAANACTAKNTLVIAPKVRPGTPNSFSGSNNLCQGLDSVLYSVNNDPLVTYSWAYSGTGLTFISQQDSNKMLANYSTTATSGTLTVSATGANGCIATNTRAITVKVSPAVPSAISGPDTVCQGVQGSIYTVLADTSVTYQWSYSGGGLSFVAPQDSNSIRGNYNNNSTSGTITLRASLPDGCSTTSTLPVRVKHRPVISNNIMGTHAPCQGATVQYSVNGYDTTINYTWSYSGTGLGFGPTFGYGNVQAFYSRTATSGLMTVVATDTSGCSVTDTATMDVKPAPAIGNLIGPDTVCQGAQGQEYYVTNDLSASYYWDFTGTGVSFSNGSFLKAAAFSFSADSGFMTVEAYGNFGCTITDSLYVVVKPAPNTNSIIAFSQNPCQNSSVTFEVSEDSLATYTWSYAGGGATMPAVLDTSRIAIYYGLSATSGDLIMNASYANGCVTTATTHVNVRPTPQGYEVTGPSSVCVGQQIQLTSTANNGQWASNHTDIASVAGNGVVTGNSPGLATIAIAVTQNACTGVFLHDVTVSESPSVSSIVAPSVKLCVGDTVTFVDSTTGGLWTSSNNNVAIVDANGHVIPLTAGSANITYAVTNGFGCTVSDVEAITTNNTPAKPVITTAAPPGICRGTELQNFGGSSSSTNGVRYTWSIVGGTATITKGGSTQYSTISFNDAGDVIVALVVGYGGNNTCTDSAFYTVHVSDNSAIQQPVIVYVGKRFSCLQNNVKTYQWGYDDMHTYMPDTLEGETNQDYLNADPDLGNHNYWVITTSSDGTCPQKSYYDAGKNHVLKPGRAAEMTLTPNPAGSYVVADVQALAVNADGFKLEISGMDGRIRKTIAMLATVQQIDLSDIPTGVYTVACYRYGKKIASAGLIKN